MKFSSLTITVFLEVSYLSVITTAQDFDFFYFVQQWPGSYCGSEKSCCYPTTGKPDADFGIHGLWPNYQDGSYPSNCDPDSQFLETKISDLIPSIQKEWPTLACPSGDGIQFWSHEWEKHGTCSESVLDEHAYFATALKLKEELKLLGALEKSGIKPDGNSYNLESIKDAIRSATGFTPWIECNQGSSGSQLYQVYICVDGSGSQLIECPIFPRGGKCDQEVVFPSF